MKKSYTTPELEVSKLTAEDILEASPGSDVDNEIFVNADSIFGN